MIWNITMVIWSSIFIGVSSYKLAVGDHGDIVWAAATMPIFVLGLVFHMIYVIKDAS